MNVTDTIYLDYNATTPLDENVKDAITKSLDLWGNPSGKYRTGRLAKEAIDRARSQISLFLNVPENGEVIFTSGGTETNNLIIQTALSHSAEKRDSGNVSLPHIITTTIEHDSILKPLKHLERKHLCSVSYVSPNPQTGSVTVEDMLGQCRAETCLVTVMLANNETGVFQPVQEICKKVQLSWKDVLVHTDVAQVLGKSKVDFDEIGVDYLTVVGHKFYGPRIGALIRKNGSPLYPTLFGGGQEKGLRPGTENTPMIVGLGVAAEEANKDVVQQTEYLQELRDYLETSLTAFCCVDVVWGVGGTGEQDCPFQCREVHTKDRHRWGCYYAVCTCPAE